MDDSEVRYVSSIANIIYYPVSVSIVICTSFDIFSSKKSCDINVLSIDLTVKLNLKMLTAACKVNTVQ